MSIRITSGAEEDGVVIGNAYDIYDSRNPIVKWMMNGFESALSEFVTKASPESIYDVGCGEGYLLLHWNEQGISARGCEFSKGVIKIALESSINRRLPPSLFESRSIYDLDAVHDSADIVVCCEVLEHLENPEAGLQALQRVAQQHLIVSVPQEPLWCALNLAKGKYIGRWGNTPSHIQRWSKSGFFQLVSKYFEVVETRNPLPWTMLFCRPYH